MYKDSKKPARILIVKTSSLGDIIQSFNVLDDLKVRFPEVAIDWVVEKHLSEVVRAHPLVSRTIALDIKGRKNLFSGLKELRWEKYDIVFDLQRNIKSGVITFLSRGYVKVGYDLQSCREWPNVLATNVRFKVTSNQNIRLFYLAILDKYFQIPGLKDPIGVQFAISKDFEKTVRDIISRSSAPFKVMVCPGSKWVNKQMKVETLIAFLKRIEEVYQASFLLVWGSESERALCEKIKEEIPFSVIVEKLPFPALQNLMNQSDFVIAVDSSALHLCGTTKTPTFSIFGPTIGAVFKPIGPRHQIYQGPCPYRKVFLKQCPILRSCSSGACIKEIKPEALFEAFQSQCETLLPGQPLEF